MGSIPIGAAMTFILHILAGLALLLMTFALIICGLGLTFALYVVVSLIGKINAEIKAAKEKSRRC